MNGKLIMILLEVNF